MSQSLDRAIETALGMSDANLGSLMVWYNPRRTGKPSAFLKAAAMLLTAYQHRLLPDDGITLVMHLKGSSLVVKDGTKRKDDDDGPADGSAGEPDAADPAD